MASHAQNLSKLAASLPDGGIVPVAMTTLTVTDSSYATISDLAIRTEGGYVKITGANFAAGCTLYVNGTPATSTTYISSTEVRAQLPAKAVGTYSLMLFNAASAAAIWASGIMYSTAPVWGATAYANTGNVINTQLLATGDSALTYSLASGVLPAGVTLSSTGLLSGTAAGITSTTTLSFTVAVTDAESQANPQLITLSITFWVGKLFVWGSNYQGALGLGNSTTYAVPMQVGTDITWKVIAPGIYNFSGIKTDGTLWSWGYNHRGQLGFNNTVNYSSPKQLGALTNWKTISKRKASALAIKTDGTLWAWGDNSYGLLGLENTTSYSSPKQVGTLTNWLSVATGYGRHSAAIKTDGTLWTWGANNGCLGLNDTADRNSPTQVGLLTNWASVVVDTSANAQEFTLAIKTDGTLWAWGRNDYGQLGNSTTSSTGQISPVQVGLLTNWLTIKASQHILTTKTDGTLWAWGRNSYGNLGNGTTVNKSSPVQIGTLTNWSKIGIGRAHSLAVKTNGTLWSWGKNAQGQLGLDIVGGNYGKSSPTQIGSLTTWLEVAGGTYWSTALSV